MGLLDLLCAQHKDLGDINCIHRSASPQPQGLQKQNIKSWLRACLVSALALTNRGASPHLPTCLISVMFTAISMDCSEGQNEGVRITLGVAVFLPLPNLKMPRAEDSSLP